MTEIYVDTSALLPLLDADDQDHDTVVACVTGLAAQGATLLTSSYTLVEAGALVRRRLGSEAFRALGEAVDRALTVAWVDEVLHWRAWKHAALEPRRGASLVDWVGFLVMADAGVETALAFDHHFVDQGFTTIP